MITEVDIKNNVRIKGAAAVIWEHGGWGKVACGCSLKQLEESNGERNNRESRVRMIGRSLIFFSLKNLVYFREIGNFRPT